MNPITFHTIEQTQGIILEQDSSVLSDWYLRVREIPLPQLRIEDLCRSLRQVLYPEYIVPVAIKLVERDPLIGEMYDGELLVAFKSIPESFWHANVSLAQRLFRVCGKPLTRMSDECRREVEGLRCKLKDVCPK
jgi:hypothetical protein